MNISQTLILIQQASGWSQEQLAQQLSVSFVTISAWITGKSQPRSRAKQAIETLSAHILGSESVDPDRLKDIVSQACSRSLSAQELVSHKKRLHQLTIELTYHTNTIEGSTMTMSDVLDVLVDNKVLANRSAVEQREAHNHRAALEYLLSELVARGKGFVIDQSLILSLHLRLMNGIRSDAGVLRSHSVRIGGSRVVLANPLKVPKLLEEFVSMCSGHKDPGLTRRQQMSPVATLARTHALFEQIHPFADGNGRVGRLLLVAQALSRGLVPPIITRSRKYAYYKYLELAQTNAQYDPLEQFIAESILYSAQVLNDKPRRQELARY